MRKTLLLAGLIMLCVTALAEGQPKSKTLPVPLAWTPKEAAALPAIDVTGGVRTLRFMPFSDARDVKSAIGENLEKKPPVSVVTPTDVAAFLSEHVARELRQLGIVSGEQGADRVVTGEVMQFWVKDAGAYDATVRMKLTVSDAAGQELWTGIVTGRGENWGRQLKPINYTEAITAAILDLVANTVRSPEFMKTIRKSGT